MGSSPGVDGVLTRHDIGVDLALVAAQSAHEESRRRGYPRFAVVVANRAGHLRAAQERRRRAASRGFRAPQGLHRREHERAHLQGVKAIDERSGEPDPHLVYLNDVLIVGGGVPIHAKGELVGAIGVAGSPGSVHDEECADAGLAAIAAGLG